MTNLQNYIIGSFPMLSPAAQARILQAFAHELGEELTAKKFNYSVYLAAHPQNQPGPGSKFSQEDAVIKALVSAVFPEISKQDASDLVRSPVGTPLFVTPSRDEAIRVKRELRKTGAVVSFDAIEETMKGP
jgi:hypothetical protein